MARLPDTMSSEDMKIIYSDEYKAYLKALCRLASGYVERIRIKFAKRAFEKYADPTIRKLVLAYGAEAEKLDEDRLFWFTSAAEREGGYLADSCTNNAHGYGRAIWFLFDIDDDKEEKE